MTTIEERFHKEKTVSVWSDWCSSGIWDGHGVCVPVEWLPVSWYAKALIHAMQTIYDGQVIDWEGDVPEPYADSHAKAYEDMREKARDQVRLELADWSVR